MRIDFKVIPHKRQRYETVGDYVQRNGIWMFRISKMSDPRYMLLVFLHEIIEFLMCKHAGISMAVIDEWDIVYELTRAKLFPKTKTTKEPINTSRYADVITEDSEPGDDRNAPYYQQHQVASQCERLIADALGVDWEAYANEVDKLYNHGQS